MNTSILSIYTVFLLLVISCNSQQLHSQQLEDVKPKNIILMIGDGMGLSQISAAMYQKDSPLAMEEAQHIGLIKTHSSSSIITDSAAGATAFSTGQKTYNGAINMSKDTIPLTPITTTLKNEKIKTGIIATSSVTHATPACFYGNQINRYGVNEALAKQFTNTNINVLMGGGEDYFNNRNDGQNLIDSLKKKNYIIIDSIIDEIPYNTEKLINFCAPKEPKAKQNGRDNFLPLATKKALDVLNYNNNHGFFIMIEGSQIDWGGHDNNSEYIISETLDFDDAVKIVIDFAKKDRTTLVLITADHETGGYGIIGRNKSETQLETGFLNNDHTATMVPLFAFGPGANKFIGTYENTDLYYKILAAYK
tara:strand:- start:231 stop:1322 length:1092 start_codon:yes stop_codon:yes gene_type:complete